MAKKDAPNDAASPMANLLEAMQATKLSPMPQADWLERMADVGSEMLSFMAARVGEDVQTQHALMHAKGVAEVQHIQAQFFQKAMDDYAAETAKLVTMGKKIASDSGIDPAVLD